MQEPLVSICCITYNHEDYIRDAIESFLMQKTEFSFEILIHDDASTDRTADIIKEYEEAYPDIIKPIYQIDNHYSKGIAVEKINFERAIGKYIALCEGDDFWTDPNKLQKQVEFMESCQECSLCVHGGYVVNAADKKIQYYNRPHKGNKIFTVEEVIEGGGGLFITNSMLFRTEFVRQLPKFYEVAPVGDYPLTIHLALLGTVYYIDEYLSAWRIGDPASWTGKNFSTLEKKEKHYEEIAVMLKELNQSTNFEYQTTINKLIKYNELYLLLKQGNFKEAKNEKYRKIYNELTLQKKAILLMDYYSPKLALFLRKNRRWINGV